MAPPQAARPITARPTARAAVRVRSAPVRPLARAPRGTSARSVGRPSARVSDFASRDPSADTRPRARDTLEHVGVGLEAPSACATPHLRPSAPRARPSNRASARTSAAHPRVQRAASGSAGCSRPSPAASRVSAAVSRVSAARAGANGTLIGPIAGHASDGANTRGDQDARAWLSPPRPTARSPRRRRGRSSGCRAAPGGASRRDRRSDGRRR